MNNYDNNISEIHARRFEEQGYTGYSRYQLNNFKWGIRHAYILCISVVIIGLIQGSIEVLSVAGTIAFFGVILPWHPFDYLYNYGTRYLINKPRVPRRTIQAKFACGLATVFLIGIILSMAQGFTTLMWMLSGILISVAVLVSTTDICIPSMIYNMVFLRKKQTSEI